PILVVPSAANRRVLHAVASRRSSDLTPCECPAFRDSHQIWYALPDFHTTQARQTRHSVMANKETARGGRLTSQKSTKSTKSPARSEEHTSELQSRENLVCRLLLEKKK